MARTFEKPAELTFQTEKITPAKEPPAGAVDTIKTSLPTTTATDQTWTDQAPVQQKHVTSLTGLTRL